MTTRVCLGSDSSVLRGEIDDWLRVVGRYPIAGRASVLGTLAVGSSLLPFGEPGVVQPCFSAGNAVIPTAPGCGLSFHWIM